MLFINLSAHSCVVLQQLLIFAFMSAELIVLSFFKSAENEDLFVLAQIVLFRVYTMSCFLSKSTTHSYTIIST